MTCFAMYIYIYILQHLCCQIELGAWGERIIITIIRMIIIRPPSPRGDGRGRVVSCWLAAYKTLPPINEVDIPLPTGAAGFRRAP